jgi:agmatine deiminase
MEQKGVNVKIFAVLSVTCNVIYNTVFMKQLYFILALAIPFAINAQRDLPRYSTEAELQLLPEPRILPGEAVSLAPPPVPVRTMAEWEEVESVIISWNTNVYQYKLTLCGIIKAAQEECKVVICVPDLSVVQDVRDVLDAQNIEIEKNIEIKVVPNNSIWVRDYGPNSVYANGVDSLLLIDWIYNRPWRKSDDNFSFPLAKSLNTSVYTTLEIPEDLVNTGGNFMSDGLGTAFSSKLILEENNLNNIYKVSPKSENDVNEIMERYMGIERYIKMETLLYDGIHHIDMHMKLLDEETLLVGQYPTGKSDGPQIEANIQYVLNNYKSVYGTPYKVVRIPMPSFNGEFPPYKFNKHLYPTYANALIVNKTVIVPSYNLPSDQAAIDTFRRYMPGYKIVPVLCKDIVADGGAVHCITKEIGVRDPIQIVHQPLKCQANQNNGYPIEALINHKSGIANAKIWYSTDLGKPWLSVNMTGIGGHALYNYSGLIPKQAEGSTVYYYIESEAFNGKKLTRPLTAPSGYWHFCVEKSLSSDEPVSASLLDIFPNPASGITAVPVISTTNIVAQIALYDALGRLVEVIHDGEIPAGKQHYFVNASRYTAGTYFICFKTHNSLKMKRLMIR